MKVFVTGGTGYIGAHVIAALVREGHEVTALSRQPPTNQQIEWVRGRLEDIETFRASLSGHDALIHCAILWGPYPTEMELPDIHASLNLFRATSEAGLAHFIYTSSTAVNFPLEGYKHEDDAVSPTDMYGATKAATELLLKALSHQCDLRLTILRPGPSIGPPVQGSVDRGPARIAQMVRTARRDETITVHGEEGRQFIGVTDLARAYLAALTAPGNRETYTVVSRDFIRWAEIARDIVDLVQLGEVEIKDVHLEPHGFDTLKLRERLGLAFEARPAMREYLEYLIAKERSSA